MKHLECYESHVLSSASVRVVYIYPLQAEVSSLHAHLSSRSFMDAINAISHSVIHMLFRHTVQSLCTPHAMQYLHCFPILKMLNDPHPVNPAPPIILQRPHLLQVPDDSHVCIHESIHAVAHAGFFATVESAGGDFRGDTFAEADVC